MSEASKKRPEQIPGEAESPPKGERHPAVEEGVGRVDETEPVQSGKREPDKKPQ